MSLSSCTRSTGNDHLRLWMPSESVTSHWTVIPKILVPLFHDCSKQTVRFQSSLRFWTHVLSVPIQSRESVFVHSSQGTVSRNPERRTQTTSGCTFSIGGNSIRYSRQRRLSSAYSVRFECSDPHNKVEYSVLRLQIKL